MSSPTGTCSARGCCETSSIRRRERSRCWLRRSWWTGSGSRSGALHLSLASTRKWVGRTEIQRAWPENFVPDSPQGGLERNPLLREVIAGRNSNPYIFCKKRERRERERYLRFWE